MTKEIKKWYYEAKNVAKEFKVKDECFIFYKGFKLIKFEDKFSIKDVRYHEFYSKVKESEYKLMSEKGFVKAVDQINFTLNEERLKKCTNRIEFLYKKRRLAKKNMQKDVRLNKKRIRLANKNIDILVDQIFLYQTRIQQFKNKYNLL